MLLAIDTGATKTLLALFDEHGQIVKQLKFPTAPNYPQYLATLATAIKTEFAPASKIILALPAPIVAGKPLKFTNLNWDDALDPRADLENTLNLPVWIENDVTLAGQSELKNTAGLSLYLAIGTGIGSALAHDGQIIPALAPTFNVGHMMLQFKNDFLEWEQFASGRALTTYFGHEVGAGINTQEQNEIAHRLGLGLLAICPLFTPLTIVFGGGVGAHFKSFEAPLQNFLHAHLSKIKENYLPTLQLASVPNEATVYGGWQYLQTHSN